jgi:hypothetical protein
LERELARKEEALAEAATLMILRKKAEAIWGPEGGGVRQGSCRHHSFSGCAICEPGHGVSAASFMGDRVGGLMGSVRGFWSLGVEPDRADGLPVARPA